MATHNEILCEGQENVHSLPKEHNLNALRDVALSVALLYAHLCLCAAFYLFHVPEVLGMPH